VHGLLKASFIPAKPQRDLRDLTRYRVTLVQERARVINRVQKVLENANIKLASVATDVLGVSRRRMLEALVVGKADAACDGRVGQGRMRNKLPLLQQALDGVVDDHHRFLVAQHLVHIDFLDEQIEKASEQIVQQMQHLPALSPGSPTPSQTDPGDEVSASDESGSAPLTWQQAADILDSTPGVDQKAAYEVLAEMGINMRQFPSANHLCAWGGLAPGNRQSGGKRFHTRLSDGNRQLRTIMVQCAWSAVPRQGQLSRGALSSPCCPQGQEARHYCNCSLDVGQFLSYAFQATALSRTWQWLFRPRSKGVKVDWLLKQLSKLGYCAKLEPAAAD